MPSVPAKSKSNQTPLLMAAAVSSLQLTEEIRDLTKRIFRGQTENDAHLPQEKQTNERPRPDQSRSWLCHIYLCQEFPHTTTSGNVCFARYPRHQNLACLVAQVIRTRTFLFGLGLGKSLATGATVTSRIVKDGFC